MPKSILIFSDGTGQAGGVTFDENRTNIYKLFRATRCGPDSPINPAEQVAFYDPGLGSPRDNHFTFGWPVGKFTTRSAKVQALASPQTLLIVTLRLSNFGVQAIEFICSVSAVVLTPCAAWGP